MPLGCCLGLVFVDLGAGFCLGLGLVPTRVHPLVSFLRGVHPLVSFLRRVHPLVSFSFEMCHQKNSYICLPGFAHGSFLGRDQGTVEKSDSES